MIIKNLHSKINHIEMSSKEMSATLTDQNELIKNTLAEIKAKININ